MSRKGKPKRTKMEMELVYADVEDHLIRLASEGGVIQRLIAKYGVSHKQVREWISEVYARYRKAQEDNPQIREDRRNLMRARIETIHSMAVNKQITLRNPDGKPVMDPVRNTPVRVPSPDLKNALDACKQLRELDGLDMPVKVDVKTEGKNELALNGADRDILEKALKGLP